MINSMRGRCPHIQADDIHCSYHACYLLPGQTALACCVFCAKAPDCVGACDTAFDVIESFECGLETPSFGQLGDSATISSETPKDASESLTLLPRSTNRPETPTVVMVELPQELTETH